MDKKNKEKKELIVWIAKKVQKTLRGKEDKGRAGRGAWNPGSSATETGRGAGVDLCVRWSIGGPLGSDITTTGRRGDLLLGLASQMGFRCFMALSRCSVAPLASVPAVALPELVVLRPLTALLLPGFYSWLCLEPERFGWTLC